VWGRLSSLRSKNQGADWKVCATRGDITHALSLSRAMNILFGRFFMLIGMVILPIGLMYGLARDDLRMEEKLLVVGGVFFLIGWLMARTRRA
jgi:uncharacterized membrane protein YgdD (TMEM256/DUF423 family)